MADEKGSKGPEDGDFKPHVEPIYQGDDRRPRDPSVMVGAGFVECVNDFPVRCDSAVTRQDLAGACNELDDDGNDGIIDEGFACPPSQEQCSPNTGIGECLGGVQTCDANGYFSEPCDGIDNDCDDDRGPAGSLVSLVEELNAELDAAAGNPHVLIVEMDGRGDPVPQGTLARRLRISRAPLEERPEGEDPIIIGMNSVGDLRGSFRPRLGVAVGAAEVVVLQRFLAELEHLYPRTSSDEPIKISPELVDASKGEPQGPEDRPNYDFRADSEASQPLPPKEVHLGFRLEPTPLDRQRIERVEPVDGPRVEAIGMDVHTALTFAVLRKRIGDAARRLVRGLEKLLAENL
jgi:hypothetical protein